jgi:glycosyltransferase involved in cell wall biosynthesis
LLKSRPIICRGLTMKESTMVTVSAVIPTRGRPELLRRAVRSALAQTLRDIEVVVVIDGPDPATHLVLQELAQQDGRLRVLALPSSVGGCRGGRMDCVPR